MDNIIRSKFEGVDDVIELGWNTLNSFRRRQHVHITDKELFFAGAGFLFDAIVTAMTKDREPTPADLELCSKIQYELVQFNQHFNLKFKLNANPDR